MFKEGSEYMVSRNCVSFRVYKTRKYKERERREEKDINGTNK